MASGLSCGLHKSRKEAAQMVFPSAGVAMTRPWAHLVNASYFSPVRSVGPATSCTKYASSGHTSSRLIFAIAVVSARSDLFCSALLLFDVLAHSEWSFVFANLCSQIQLRRLSLLLWRSALSGQGRGRSHARHRRRCARPTPTFPLFTQSSLVVPLDHVHGCSRFVQVFCRLHGPVQSVTISC